MPGALTQATHATYATAHGAADKFEHGSEHREACGDDGDVGFDGRPDGGVGVVPGDVHWGQLQQEGQSVNTRRCYAVIPEFLATRTFEEME